MSSSQEFSTDPEAGKTPAPEQAQTPCGGCGAMRSEERCIGCMHMFFPGDWPEKYQS